MALSKKLTNPAKSPQSVEALIMKGGTSGEGMDESQDETGIRMVQLRMSITDINQIDKIRKKRPGKVSRHTWIMEAIEEKLARDADVQ